MALVIDDSPVLFEFSALVPETTPGDGIDLMFTPVEMPESDDFGDMEFVPYALAICTN